MSTHAERILLRLNELGWNKTMLAEKAMIQPATLSRLLKSDDARLKRAQTMARIARALGVRAEWLMSGAEPKIQNQESHQKSHQESGLESTDIMEELGGGTLSRLCAVAEAYLCFIQENKSELTAEKMAKEITSLFIKSILENTFDMAELRKILTGERKTALPPANEQSRETILRYLF